MYLTKTIKKNTPYKKQSLDFTYKQVLLVQTIPHPKWLLQNVSFLVKIWGTENCRIKEQVLQKTKESIFPFMKHT